MANITGSTNEKVFSISKWLGLNENPDGDTKLKMGEAAAMKNWQITRDGNLRRRPGCKLVVDLAGEEESPVQGMWTGFIKGHEVLLAACKGKLWSLWDDVNEEYIKVEIGSLSTANNVFMFGFSDIVYIMNGVEYYQWDGTTFGTVDGYVPLTYTELTPENGGTQLEQINKLTPKRRVYVSPDGKATVYHLPEQDLQSVDFVKNSSTDEALTGYTTDLINGTVTFNTAPQIGTDTIEIGYTVKSSYRGEVCGMRYAELYNGSQDTRVFIYGNGTNECFYSDIDHDGKPRADYFPDMNEIAVGDSNTPITGLIRHYSMLVAYKTNSAWMMRYGAITLADGSVIAAFYVVPVNRSIGNVALGQVMLVNNSPITLFGNDLFEWRNNSSYASNLNVDERQAKRISDRVYATLGTFDFSQCICWDDNDSQEYYVCDGNRALVHNYAANAWYYYEGLNVSCMVNFHGYLYIGTRAGEFIKVGYEYLNDNGVPISAYWESGSISFNADYMRKFAATMWIGVKPESRSEVIVTVQTDKKSEYAEKVVSTQLASFSHMNFAKFSFRTNRKPAMKKLKIKAKKFVFYKLIFTNEEPNTTATVLAADIRVRYTGEAK